MIRSNPLGGRLVAAMFLASLLIGSIVPSAAAYTTGNADPSVTVTVGTPAAVGLNYTLVGSSAADALPVPTTFAVTVPAGYSWTALPTVTTSAGLTITGPVASNSNLTETWTLTAFAPSGAWSITLSGGSISATNAAGNGSIVLRLNGAAGVEIAKLFPQLVAGTLVPVTINPAAVPADGASQIHVTFGGTSATCSNGAAFTVTTTNGTFTATSLVGATLLPGSVVEPCANFGTIGAKTITLTAPTTAGTAVITVMFSGATTADSSTTVTFTAATPPPGGGAGGQGGRDGDRGKGNGARKTGFFLGGSCAAAATPAAGAKTFGFAVFNTTGKGMLNVTIALRGLTPNATFTVAISQAGACGTPFTIKTNAKGNWTGHHRYALVKDATSFWVTATGTSGSYATKAVALHVKSHGKGHGKGHQE